MRYAPRLLRATIKDWAGEQDKRESGLTERETKERVRLEAEIARLRAELVKENQERELNADLCRAWYWKAVEITVRTGGSIEDLPQPEKLGRIGPDEPALPPALLPPVDHGD